MSLWVFVFIARPDNGDFRVSHDDDDDDEGVLSDIGSKQLSWIVTQAVTVR